MNLRNIQKVDFFKSRKSPKLYFLWRRDRSLSAINKVRKYNQFEGKRVLDLGCGYGSLTSIVCELGARVTATEIDKDKLKHAKIFLKDQRSVELILVNDETLPFETNTFDIVFIFDVIEHVRNPKKLINEAFRVLKKGGIMYVEFTPYYSLVGHHLYDYTKFPIHLLPEKIIKRFVYSKKTKGFISMNARWEGFKSLNKLRVSKFVKMCRKFEKLEEKRIFKYPGLFEFSIPFIKMFGRFGEIFTFSFEGVYRK